MRILGKSDDFDDFLIKNLIFSLKTLWVRSITYGRSRRAHTDPGPLTSDQGHRGWTWSAGISATGHAGGVLVRSSTRPDIILMRILIKNMIFSLKILGS